MHLPVLTPEHMAECDRRTIESGTPGEVLMERAGSACFRETVRLAGGTACRRFVVLAGPGNNGGDGFVVARYLARQHAYVRCVLVGDVASARGDAALNLRRMQRAGVVAERFTGFLPEADVVVDALFGTGFRGEVSGDAAAAIAAIPETASVLAVDIASGVDGTSGAVSGVAVRADVTVAIQALKCGHVLEPGAGRAGTIVVAGIGIDPGVPDAWLADAATAVAAVPERARTVHKWSAGGVMVVGGSAGMSGAPQLASHAAFRAGAGIVVAAVPAPIQPLVAGAFPELMTMALPETGGRLDGGSVAALDRPGRFRAVAVGPGAGRSENVSAFVRSALATLVQTVVLDADGLNAVHGSELAQRAAPTIVTPHDGEFARLGGDDVTHDAVNRMAAVQAAAEAWGVTVLLKGPSTIVASPGEAPFVVRGGGPELATAGSGDTLTGVIAALAARGTPVHLAPVAAACIHAEAGRMAAADGRWVMAGDLADHLGAAERLLRADTSREAPP